MSIGPPRNSAEVATDRSTQSTGTQSRDPNDPDGLSQMRLTHSSQPIPHVRFSPSSLAVPRRDDQKKSALKRNDKDLDVERTVLRPVSSVERGNTASADLTDYGKEYGQNRQTARSDQRGNILQQMKEVVLDNKTLIILFISAAVSVALGLAFPCESSVICTDQLIHWREGVAILVAVLIIAIIRSVNNWLKKRQLTQLSEESNTRTVKIIRESTEQIVDIKNVVLGDIALLKPGEIIPCDGLLLSGHNVKCDESGTTGESDAIKKVPYELCVRAGAENVGQYADCFLISGSKVLEGVGSYVVVAVGAKTFTGRIKAALRRDRDDTPLQTRHKQLEWLTATLGKATGLLLFTALMIRFFVQLGTGNPVRNSREKGLVFVQIVVITTTVVVAVLDRLSLALTLALSFATKRMAAENLLVRVLSSCEIMASTSVICTDKTGTLTQNEMTVVAGFVGIDTKFVRHLEEKEAHTNTEKFGSDTAEHQAPDDSDDFLIDQSQLNDALSPQLRRIFNEAIAINSTAFEDANVGTGANAFLGNKTETALLRFAKELGWKDCMKVRTESDIVQMIPFSSERKAMAVVVRVAEGRWRLYVKGASEILAKKCTRYVVVCDHGEVTNEVDGNVKTREIDELAKTNISKKITFYASQTMRTIALCYRDFYNWPPDSEQLGSEELPAYEDLAYDMTLIGVTSIEDPLREGVREAVLNCQKAGVVVKMCTGDNLSTARSIALQCGIFTAGGIIMEGSVFRRLNDRDLLELLPRLQVLARSSPEDKRILVQKLSLLGEVVGVTGDGTNDGPALKAAHVGFSMGLSGTEVAKEASDIILANDEFASIVKAIMWGRCVNDAVRKFLQFQASVNIATILVAFISAIASAQADSVLSAVQLLWINVIISSFIAVALSTNPASVILLDRRPQRKTAPLFSVDMYKQIIGQSTYQVGFALVFLFAGNAILNFQPKPMNESTQIHNTEIINTLVFNAFVFANIFNSLNCRRIDNKWNIFEGITKNYYFIALTAIEIAFQIVVIFVGGQTFGVTNIGGREWGISLALGVMSLPIGVLIRLIPNHLVERFLIKLRILDDPNILPTTSPAVEWNSAITLVRDGLNTFANKYHSHLRDRATEAVKNQFRRPEEPSVQIRSLLVMVPTLVASSIGAGWTPQSSTHLHDPALAWEDTVKFELHPDTAQDDTEAFRLQQRFEAREYGWGW